MIVTITFYLASYRRFWIARFVSTLLSFSPSILSTAPLHADLSCRAHIMMSASKPSMTCLLTQRSARLCTVWLLCYFSHFSLFSSHPHPPFRSSYIGLVFPGTWADTLLPQGICICSFFSLESSAWLVGSFFKPGLQWHLFSEAFPDHTVTPLKFFYASILLLWKYLLLSKTLLYSLEF